MDVPHANTTVIPASCIDKDLASDDGLKMVVIQHSMLQPADAYVWEVPMAAMLESETGGAVTGPLTGTCRHPPHLFDFPSTQCPQFSTLSTSAIAGYSDAASTLTVFTASITTTVISSITTTQRLA